VCSSDLEQRLERHDFVALAIVDFVDHTHSTDAEQAQDLETVWAVEIEADWRTRELARGDTQVGRQKEIASVLVGPDQPIDVLDQRMVAVALLLEPGAPGLGAPADGTVEQLIDDLPARGIHPVTGREVRRSRRTATRAKMSTHARPSRSTRS